MSTRHTKKEYDKFGHDYHKKRSIPEKNFYNLYIDYPAMSSVLKNIVKGKKVLDLGCGSGIFTKQLASWGARVKGIDLSKTLVEIAKKENPKIEFLVGDARKTPFKNKEFDIMSSNLVAHYFKDLKALFKEANRILKHKGLFMFTIHHPFNEVMKKDKESRKIIKVKPYFNNNRYTWEMAGMTMINYHHTFENIINSLNDSGFVTERIIETKPVRAGKNIRPDYYEYTAEYPSFCLFKARKTT